MDDDENIIEVFDDYKDTLPAELVPFAFDPAGNLICFDYKMTKITLLWYFGNMKMLVKRNVDARRRINRRTSGRTCKRKCILHCRYIY